MLGKGEEEIEGGGKEFVGRWMRRCVYWKVVLGRSLLLNLNHVTLCLIPVVSTHAGTLI